MKIIYKSQTGQFLVELLVAIGLMTILVPAIVTALVAGTQGKADQEQRIKAVAFLNEAKEALLVIREGGWVNVEENGSYHPEVVDNTWELADGEEEVDGFRREILIADIERDDTGTIVSTGGTVDPSSKKVTITISWDKPTSNSISSEFYLTRYMDNLVMTDTLEAEFDAGRPLGTVVVNDYGGEVVLSGGGRGDWCRPNDFIVDELDLPHDGRAQVVKAIEHKAFTGTDWANQGVFAEIDINNDNPPNATISELMAGYDTNDIFLDENYAYIATDDPHKDIVIYDIHTEQEVGYYDAPDSLGTAQGIYVKGNYGYTTVGFYLHTFDLSSKTGSRPNSDSLFLWGTGRRLVVQGNYAFIAVEWGLSEMKIVNVANPKNIYSSGQADVNGEYGREVFVNESGTRAYLTTSRSSSKREFFIIDTSSKSGWRPVRGEYDSGDMDPRGVVAVTGNKAVLVGTGGEEYQVVDILDETHPTRCGGINVNEGIYGIASVLESDGDAYSYIVTKDIDNEFKVIEGGPGNQYVDDGTFESRPIDIGYSTAFNYIIFDTVLPVATSVSYQVAVADAKNGSCEEAAGVTYDFLGPDGTADTFYSTEGSIFMNNDNIGYENPGRCFKYKVFLHTDDTLSTPVFREAIINYSP